MKPYYQDEWVTLFHGDALQNREWVNTDVLITDPPYGMNYQSRNKTLRAIVGDNDINLRDQALTLWGAKPAIVFGTWKAERPNNVRQLIVWDKRGGAGFSGDLNMPWADITEEIYIIGSGWTGKRRPAIYSIPTLPSGNRPNHPTPKPVSLMAELMNHVPKQWVIADPFAGSGATLLAAKQMGRKAVGIEIDEQYCAMIADRLSQQMFDFSQFDNNANDEPDIELQPLF